MNKIIFILSIALLVASCGQHNAVNQQVHSDTTAPTTNATTAVDKKAATTAPEAYPTWMDTVITGYVKHSGNELIRQAMKDSTFEEWLLDSEPNANNPRFRFQIGHDVTDEGGNNPRFVTDQWIDIDSATRKLYEYDVARDTVVLWEG